jgi:malate synthase
MVINGLNSGANTYMADFEDSSAPTWSVLTEGQRNLRDAVNGTISFTNPNNGKVYAPRTDGKLATLLVRPRGWHLDEAHVTVNGEVMSGALFDFGLYFFHNVHNLLKKGSGPYFYLPKLEGYLESRLWNDVFVAAQDYMGVPVGTIRATILLETITAAFEMEEILYEIRDHSIGLNCGRWDYLFSYIKKLKCHSDRIAPDRSHLSMLCPFMDAYVKKLIYTCHKRGTFAMGGMSATIPIKNDPAKHEAAMEDVRKDKLREVSAGHDGTWVAHPDLVKIARGIFDEHMKTPNQIHRVPVEGASITQEQLLELPVVPAGTAITSAGLKSGVAIVLAYSEAWLRGIGCIPLHHKMEDAATAEISRVQIWQWRRHGQLTQDDGQPITSERVAALVLEEVANMRSNLNAEQKKMTKWQLAGKLVTNMLTGDKLDEFLTSVCYPHILTTAYEGSVVPDFDVPSKL